MKKFVLQAKRILAAACIVFMASAVFTPSSTVVEAKTLQQLKNERQSLAQKTQQAKNALAAAQKQKAGMQQEIDALDKVVAAASEELNKSREDLEDVSNRLEESQAALEKATAEREQQFEVFGERIKFFYEKGDTGYLDIVLESKSVSDMLARMQYVEDIMQYDNKLLDNLKEAEQTIKVKTAEIAEEKAEVEELVKENEAKQQELNKALDEKKAKLQSYESDEKKYQEMIASNEKASQNVERLINQAAAEAAKASSRSSSKSSGSSGGSTGSSGGGTVYTGGKLNWPVPAKAASSSSLSSGFVNRISPISGRKEHHTGYDIPAPYGSAIVAAEGGTVIYSGWMSGYGNTIMISHGGGLVTLYGHNSSLVVSKGQTVSRGQTVAKCGSTGWSTGNHCHFEVRVNGAAVSPAPYLGVANISS